MRSRITPKVPTAAAFIPSHASATYRTRPIITVIVGTTVIFAYLLALTVFLLDFIYAIVDPRVKVGSGA